MFLTDIPNIENLLEEVFRIIQNGPFDIHVQTLGDVYVDNFNMGGSYKSKNISVEVAGLLVNLSSTNKHTHWKDSIELTYNNTSVHFNSEKI